MTREEFERLVEESLDTAIRGGHPTAEASIRIIIAKDRQGTDSLSQIEMAVELLTDEPGHWHMKQLCASA